MKKLFIALMFLLLVAGCLQPVVRLGCCLRSNATNPDPAKQGCVLYNTTSLTTTDAYFRKCTGPGDKGCTNNCTDLGCNLSIFWAGAIQNFMVPICTEDQLVSCVSPNCTAMVCGDFAFKPKVAPGMGDTNDAAATAPPDTEQEGGAYQFYNAQCRFFSMDSKLSQIMKNSKSQINVFRVGVGGSFDEFDQYRYFFPVSDKYCNLNQRSGRVDRYMNYLTGSGTRYDDPIGSIGENCLDDSSAPPPFGFGESAGTRTSTVPGIGSSVTYSIKVPDTSDYKRAHYGRMNINYTASEVTDGIYSYAEKAPYYIDTQNGIYKRIDERYYRRALAIAHAPVIYDKVGRNTTIASFECNSAGNDCYSGNCNTMVYNRGVLLDGSNVSDPNVAPEVVADCNYIANELGTRQVICAPTMDIGTATSPPTFQYARANIKPVRIGTYDSGGSSLDRNTILAIGDLTNGNETNKWWLGFPAGTLTSSYDIPYRLQSSNSWDITNSTKVDWYLTQKKNCPWETYDGVDNESTVWCSWVAQSSMAPPVAGAVFFGKWDKKVVNYSNRIVIGYSTAKPGDFENMLVVKNCNMVAGVDYISVPLWGGLNAAQLPALMTAFEPYYESRVKAMKSNGFNDGCGNLQVYDAVVSSMPWVTNYYKEMTKVYTVLGDHWVDHDEYDLSASHHLTSTPAQMIRTRNMYDDTMDTITGTSSCELRRTTNSERFDDRNIKPDKHIRFIYSMAMSTNIYLFTYTDKSKRIGDCMVDDATYLPNVRTYGWCEPCATSTLAFQNITAAREPYLPAYNVKLTSPAATNQESICKDTVTPEWIRVEDGYGHYEVLWRYNASCFHRSITDIQDYWGSIGETGVPRSRPEASIMKERLGDYMKAGIMPVLDLSDDSNWNVTSKLTKGETNYSEYDFRRMFGEMGAAVTIVGHVKGKSDINLKRDTIIDRSAALRDYCFGCLNAIHIDTPMSNASVYDIANYTFSDPRINFNIDLVTFDYPVSQHTNASSAEMVVDDIASYGLASLQARGSKPSMVVGLNIQSNDGRWTNDNYTDLFGTIVTKQDRLVKAGITGIIYMPVRDSGASGKGIVDTGSGTGIKGSKFCAMEEAVYRMSTTPPTAMFSKIVPIPDLNCTECSGMDKALGRCGSQVCDDGKNCTLPPGLSLASAKCPDNTITKGCPLCKDEPGHYTCTQTFSNGTVITLTGSMSSVSSDLYMDIIAGLGKPDKCCIQDPGGTVNYSYSKTAYATQQDKPIVFPRSGDPNTDCGFGSSVEDINKLTSFCGVRQTQVKEYDINCTSG